MVAAAEISARVAQQLGANGRIRVCAEHDRATLAARGPADHITRRRIAWPAAGGPLLRRGLLLFARLASIRGRSGENCGADGRYGRTYPGWPHVDLRTWHALLRQFPACAPNMMLSPF